jgi:small subunit ribosomal protein S16e
MPPMPKLIPSALLRYKVYEPVLVVGSEKFANIDIRLRVKGGGHVSQLYALRQAIAKGIVAWVSCFMCSQARTNV